MKVKSQVLIATLGTLEKEKNLKYHDQLMDWQQSFDKIGVQVLLMTCDSQQRLDEIKRIYHSGLEYRCGTDHEIYKNSIHTYNNFGKIEENIRPYLWFYDGEKFVAQAKRINPKSLKNMNDIAIEYMLRLRIKNFFNKK